MHHYELPFLRNYGAIQLTIILYFFVSIAKFFHKNLTNAVFAHEYAENFSHALNEPPPEKNIIFEYEFFLVMEKYFLQDIHSPKVYFKYFEPFIIININNLRRFFEFSLKKKSLHRILFFLN